MKFYQGYVPPCGIYCGGCPRYRSGGKSWCEGAETGCKIRKCKSIYVCCVEKKGLRYCYQCKSYPCSRFQKFAKSWLQYGENLLDNQQTLRDKGSQGFLSLFWDMADGS